MSKKNALIDTSEVKREINKVIIHCTATPFYQRVTVDDVTNWHKKRGWSDIGYHYFISLEGNIFVGRALKEQGAHCKHHNEDSIGICYEGGLDQFGNPADTRSAAQKLALWSLVTMLMLQFPGATVHGHREFSEDKNQDGIISPDEYTKSCPCFDAHSEWLNELERLACTSKEEVVVTQPLSYKRGDKRREFSPENIIHNPK